MGFGNHETRANKPLPSAPLNTPADVQFIGNLYLQVLTEMGGFNWNWYELKMTKMELF